MSTGNDWLREAIQAHSEANPAGAMHAAILASAVKAGLIQPPDDEQSDPPAGQKLRRERHPD